ncbi:MULTISPECIES: ABC transporter ATP-binding protein [Salimicrobium]|uniref:ABC transporter n=3 Tax=Salimicrobium TaxID=351195 RepID=K2H474_9BACI|nr:MULTISPECIES: ABC transporter ATP-binding protein [Salimicrobium]AKG05045.1 ABC transporter [Salimicrobium jeotgali]EKE30645.1 ABC-type transport system ATP-binding protein [Salimicrobium jeotgali]MBM7696880.1 ABC-2 type transport system ATP-binding protein [Salimicrobium jeotgali]SDX47954.1 ABC-2 type transport system ATP-binding protein [Salimicrobium album]SIS44348.1 ABC-2 type transport system ATP-binding protein [Salimicrobium salexigens]
MLELHNVTKRYAGKTAVHNLDLRVTPGKIFGFLGPNGAGKSTTIKMITGILPVDEGSISINGKDIEKDALEAKRQFGYVPDTSDSFLRLKGREYLEFIADVYDVPEEVREERLARYASLLQLNEALEDKLHTYSHGMRQKVVLLGVLIHQPDVWILDEPLTGLDPKSANALKELMREQADAGKIVFFSSHVLEVVEQLCDEVAIIDEGSLRFQGEMSDMRQEFQEGRNLESLFLELTNDA